MHKTALVETARIEPIGLVFTVVRLMVNANKESKMLRDNRPGTKLGVYLKELPGMVSKEAADMFVKEHKFTPMTCVQHRATWNRIKRRNAAARLAAAQAMS